MTYSVPGVMAVSRLHANQSRQIGYTPSLEELTVLQLQPQNFLALCVGRIQKTNV